MVRAGPGYTGDNYISYYGSKRWRSRSALVQVSAFRKRELPTDFVLCPPTSC